MAITPGYVAANNGQVPDVPLIGSLSIVDNVSLDASWSAPASGKHTPLTYLVSVYDINGNLLSANSASVAASNITARVTGLSPSTTYKVKVKLVTSFNSSSESAFSNLATTSSPPPPPVVPPTSPPEQGGGPPSTTTWYCSMNAVGGYTSNYTSTNNETYYICDSQIVVCSTSGYPGPATIPACDTGSGGTTNPAPVCTASCPPYPSWPACPSSTVTQTRTCTAADCSTYTQTRSRTPCPPPTCTPYTNYGSYGACSNIKYIGGKQYCGTKYRNVSWRNSDCSTGTYTQSASCCVTVG